MLRREPAANSAPPLLIFWKFSLHINHRHARARFQVVSAKVFYGVKRVDQGSDMFLHVNVKGAPSCTSCTYKSVAQNGPAAGVAMISPQLNVHSFIRYNMISSWAVDGDVFRVRAVQPRHSGLHNLK